MRYGDIKQELYDCFWTQFSPYREKRDYLEKHKDYVIKKLDEGSQKATIIADSFLDKARSAMGLNYRRNNV